ncbi:MAG: S8 family serine peptidase [Chloroherpetonaceae bacterium]|nr:S8 family serine peptidase [Chthonomonadaceae bacterium]MDW8208868.1 S8 family serine peptidase [Chloroherpetonaceae bacterium]
MNYLPRLMHAGRVLSFIVCFGVFFAARVQAQAEFVPGQIVLYMHPGTPRADVDALANSVQAQVKPLLLTDCYKLTLPEARRNNAETLETVTRLKMDRRVRWVGPNYLFKAFQQRSEPNDPRYQAGDQPNLRAINMPQAWAITRGRPGVNVAVIDTGFRPQHEDSRGRFLPESRDMVGDDNDVTDETSDHGTGVAAIINATTNNGIGMAAVCWEGVQVLALKASPAQSGDYDFTALLDSYAYILANYRTLNIVAVNMSYGGAGDPNDTSRPDYVAIRALADAGVIPVAASGNDGGSNRQILPGAYPFVVAVSALNNNGIVTTYSDTGKIEMSAPGGEIADPNNPNDPGGILTLGPPDANNPNGTYIRVEGTSQAAPHVTAAIAMIRSIPGVTAQQALRALYEGANRTGLAVVPDPRYGYGRLDVYNSVLRVSVGVKVLEPFGTDAQGNPNDPGGSTQPVETLAPMIRLQISNVPLSASDNAEHLIVTIDGVQQPESLLLNSVESGTTTGAFPQYTLAFRLPAQFRRTGEHTIVVRGTNPNTSITQQDQIRFVISPHVVPAGISFISIPYFESATDSPTGQFREALQLLGPDATLFRWIYTPVASDSVPTAAGRYAVLAATGSEFPDNAKFQAVDAVTSAGAPGAISDVRPVGLAYFVRTPVAVPVATHGRDLSRQEVRVPLHEGWNMVGDPYPYPVSFNTVLVETATGERLTAQQAVDQKLILPYVYRFIGGEYTVQQLPGGIFAPWEGHWIFVRPRTSGVIRTNKVLTLIFTPTRAGTTTRGRSAGSSTESPTQWVTSARPGVSGPGSWALRLEARVGSLTDSQNFVGMTTRATDGDDLTKVPKPPLPSPFVSLGISRPNAPDGLGLYAQDLRPIGGTRTWDLVVNTDQPNAEVTLSWPDVRAVPRNYRLTLTDRATGQTIDLRNQSSYRYNTGRSAGPRQFVLTARPTGLTGRAVVSNIFVNPARSANGRSASVYEIGYTVSQDVRVEVAILSFGGRMLAQVAPTRSVPSGDNRVVWNGRDSAGRELPAGTYILQIKAITAEGEVTREVRPLVLTGR